MVDGFFQEVVDIFSICSKVVLQVLTNKLNLKNLVYLVKFRSSKLLYLGLLFKCKALYKRISSQILIPHMLHDETSRI